MALLQRQHDRRISIRREKYYVVLYQDSDDEWEFDNIDAESGWIAITDV